MDPLFNIVRRPIGGFAHVPTAHTLELADTDGRWHEVKAVTRKTTESALPLIVDHYECPTLCGARRIPPMELSATSKDRLRIKAEAVVTTDGIGEKRAARLHRVVGAYITKHGLVETHGTFVQKCVDSPRPLNWFEDLTDAQYLAVRRVTNDGAPPVRPFARDERRDVLTDDTYTAIAA